MKAYQCSECCIAKNHTNEDCNKLESKAALMIGQKYFERKK